MLLLLISGMQKLLKTIFDEAGFLIAFEYFCFH